jgi:hypothetical protein
MALSEAIHEAANRGMICYIESDSQIVVDALFSNHVGASLAIGTYA